ncbi:MAG TPA: hypothetical protein VFT91_09430 [Dehalococcoidia bacterium]|nr:hypothetical protein [Dehalococcoidia bacterium]
MTEERLAHVLGHPEMVGEEVHIEETLRDPDVVIQSRSDPEVRLYHRLYQTAALGQKYLCAVVKWRSDDAFLITAYFTDTPKRGTQLWTRR